MSSAKKEFLENLAITQKYIKKYKLSENRTTDLRTLNFKIDNQYIFSFEEYETGNILEDSFLTTKWKNNPIHDKNNIQKLFNKQIQLKKEKLADNIRGEISGRILISNYYDTLWEGFCEIVTEGFADEHDLLPIDTWFYLENGLLYSWIPDEYIEIASDCISASSSDIFCWHEKDINRILKIKEKSLIEEMKTVKKRLIKTVNSLKNGL